MHSLHRRTALALLAALAVCSVALSVFVVTPTIALDDPFIGLRYATNLTDGAGLVFNAGEEAVEGYTAFLWILVGALGMVLGIEPLTFWQVVSSLAQVATLWIVYRLGLQPGRSRYRALLAPALLACHVAFVAYPMFGMGATFITMLVALAVLLVDRGFHTSRGGALALGVLLLTICLTRFDGLILVGVLLAYLLVVQRDVKRSIPTLVVLGLGLVVYNAWRVAYYGDLLPNTFYAKTSNLEQQLRGGMDYLSHFAFTGGPYLLLVLLLPLVAFRATKTVMLAAWVAGGHLAYVFVVGGDWMPDYRFILTVLPLLCFLLQESIWVLDEIAGLRRLALGAAVMLLFALNLRPLVVSEYVRQPPVSSYWSATDARKIGMYLSETLPADSLVAVEWAGIIPFYMRQPVLDIFGLSDREITSGDFPGSRMGKGITAEFLVSRDPGIVIFCARVFDTLVEAQVGTRCRPQQTWVYRFYTSLTEPRYGYELCIMKMGDEGYWPCLIRSDLPNRDALCAY